MIRRDVYDNGVVVYRSTLIESFGGDAVLHGFSTRLGGLSEVGDAGEDFAGLDLGIESDSRVVAANWRRLRKSIEMQRMIRREVRQVHGSAVKVWQQNDKPMVLRDAPQADGMVSANANEMLAIRTADCGSVLLVGKTSEKKLILGALHAGWRSVVSGIAIHTVDAMIEKGCLLESIVCAIGPCIGVEAFEVGNEVAEQFESIGLPDCVVRRDDWGVSSTGRPYIDLSRAIQQQLRRLGVSNDRIDVCDQCTYTNTEEFYSYRRSVGHNNAKACGRMAAVISFTD
ncbi:laccase domain-containing protein [Planctomycetota bacterium]|nr:laccase domain-containing protein [Planctomycetota bacterium]